MAMVLYPQVQERAYQEIFSVVGLERSPTLEDLPNMPYMNALFYEVSSIYWILKYSFANLFGIQVLRWRPVAPLGLPHCM